MPILKQKQVVNFAPKAMLSDCGNYRLTYSKQEGWRVYKKALGDPTAWIVLVPGILYSSRSEAVKVVQAYHRVLVGA